jgi:ferric-dicitrate binding protein FerR (iron transport regulator)
MYMRQQRSVSLAVFLLVTLPSFAPSGLANTHNPEESPSLAGISHARVVSLSLVEGTVIARRPGSSKWARATLNMPIEQGVSIATARLSFAEVQFENGSTVRLGELSRIDFMQMAFASRSGYVNHLNLAVGFATINIIPKRHDEYVLTAAGASLLPHGKTEFRVDLSRGHLRVEVFDGRVQAADSSQSEQLRRNQVLACDYNVRALFHVTDTIQMDEWDRWVQMKDRQASLAAYSGPGPGMYDWEKDLIPFGGLFPGAFEADGF